MNVLFVVACLGAALCAAAAHASVVSHNGTVTSLPPGTGQVDVFLIDANPIGYTVQKDFREITVHEMIFQAPSSPVFGQEVVRNMTSLPWTDYHITIDGASDWLGSDLSTPVPSVNPVVFFDGNPPAPPGNLIPLLSLGTKPISVSSSMLNRDGDMLSLWIFFDEPVDPGEGFTLGAVNLVNSGAMFITQGPSVPEPSTWALAAICLAGVVAAKRDSWICRA